MIGERAARSGSDKQNWLVEASRAAPCDRVPPSFAVSGRQDLNLRPLDPQTQLKRRPTSAAARGAAKTVSVDLSAPGCIRGRCGQRCCRGDDGTESRNTQTTGVTGQSDAAGVLRRLAG